MPSLAPPSWLPWQWLFGSYAFLLGACLGSFLNVCIYRIPAGLSVVTPRSHCPRCRAPVAWHDNVPLLAFCLLRGRCRRCLTAISPRYVLVELLLAVLFCLVWLKYPFAGAWTRPLALAPLESLAAVPAYWLAISGLALGSFVDLDHMIIPDRVTLGGMAAGLALSLALPELHGASAPMHGFALACGSAALGWGLLWSVARVGRLAFGREAMGFGDVKLMGAIGAFLGWRAVLFTLMTASFAGALVGVVLIAIGRKQLQSRIPFGPYLSFAAVLWILWGPSLWTGYLRLLGLVGG